VPKGAFSLQNKFFQDCAAISSGDAKHR